MALYSKSISEIVAAKLNKGKKIEVEGPSKSELKEAAKEEKRAAKEAEKEEKRLAKEQEKEEKRLAKEAAKQEKKSVKEVPPPPPPSPVNESIEGETAVEMEVDVPEPKVKIVETVKVKKNRKPKAVPVEGKVAKAKKSTPPKWFLEYNKGMQAARGITDAAEIKEAAQANWEEEGLPKRVESEREKHVSRMYGMMFGK
jgi:hypothetical protein